MTPASQPATGSIALPIGTRKGKKLHGAADSRTNHGRSTARFEPPAALIICDESEGSAGYLEHGVIHLLCFIIFLHGFLSPVAHRVAMAADTSEPMSVWQAAPPPTPDQPTAPRKPWVLREREITLDLQLLQVLKDAAARPHPRVVVELFDGERHELDITSTVSRIDTAVIRGTFKPPSRGNFTFVASGNLLVGSMQLGDRLYKTEHIANGRVRLLEVDPAKLPPD
jgi:hypothetical protein